jgi:hypothetical protein
MIEPHFIRIARELSVFALTGVIIYSVWGGADKDRKAEVLRDGRVAFTPNRRSFWAWPLLVIYSTYATLSQVMHAQRSPLSLTSAALGGVLTITIAISFPAKIIVTSEGLEQVCWLWKNKRIRWDEIVEINTGEKSHLVTITGADGTKIVHGHQLPDRSRLLFELRHHCGENLPSDFPREPMTDFQDATTGN